MNNNKRNYGIDLLRIVAAYMIVVLHCFTQGGLLEKSELGSIQHKTALIGSILSVAGVNLFAIISGYVSGKREKVNTQYSRYIELWLVVIFYNFLIGGIMSCFLPEFSVLDNLRLFCLPVMSREYWYFTAFTGLYMLKPLIDRGLKSCSANTLKKLVVVIFISFSTVATVSDILKFDTDLFNSYRGYSVLWIVLLYIVGYSVCKCELFKKYKSWVLLISLLVVWLITYLLETMIMRGSIMGYTVDSAASLLYISPATLITAIILVVIFSRLDGEKLPKRVISFLAPTVFSIYLINCNPIIFNEIIKDLFVFACSAKPLTIIWLVLRFSIIFTLSAIIIDVVRIVIFKVLKIKVLSVKIESLLKKLINGIIKVL